MELICRDLYLRYNKGPIQCFRVWDADLFLKNQRDNGQRSEKVEDRFTVTMESPGAYQEQQRNRRE